MLLTIFSVFVDLVLFRFGNERRLSCWHATVQELFRGQSGSVLHRLGNCECDDEVHHFQQGRLLRANWDWDWELFLEDVCVVYALNQVARESLDRAFCLAHERFVHVKRMCFFQLFAALEVHRPNPCVLECSFYFLQGQNRSSAQPQLNIILMSLFVISSSLWSKHTDVFSYLVFKHEYHGLVSAVNKLRKV